MPDICQTCGLPTEICACQDIARESQRIRIYTMRRKYGKLVTIVEGIKDDVNVDDLTKQLKSKCACGGTYKEYNIELQGEHREKVRGELIKLGFPNSAIEVK